MADHATKTDGAWRVYRFEKPDGKYAEVASNQVGPEAIPLPPGYCFVKATEMVSVDAVREAIDYAVEITKDDGKNDLLDAIRTAIAEAGR